MGVVVSAGRWYLYCMEAFVTFTDERAEELGIHFEWAGFSALTVRIVDNASGDDVDVFSLSEPATTAEVGEWCVEWLDSALAQLTEGESFLENWR